MSPPGHTNELKEIKRGLLHQLESVEWVEVEVTSPMCMWQYTPHVGESLGL